MSSTLWRAAILGSTPKALRAASAFLYPGVSCTSGINYSHQLAFFILTEIPLKRLNDPKSQQTKPFPSIHPKLLYLVSVKKAGISFGYCDLGNCSTFL